MAIDLNKSGEEKPKPKFNLSKSSDPPPEIDNTKGLVEPKQKFDLSKTSGQAPVVDVQKGEKEQKKKIDISKPAEPASQTPVKKGATPEPPPAKGKSKKTILFSIIGLICLALIIWLVTTMTKSPDQKTALAGQDSIGAQTKIDANTPANAEANDNKTGPSNPTDSSTTAVSSQKQPSGESQVTKGTAAPAGNQANQVQGKNANTAGQNASKQSALTNANIPYKKNESYKLYQFPFGDFNYSQADPDLDKLAEVLKQNPSMKISISAYTDDIGDPDFNKNLSERRAKSIRDYLMTKGIDAGRIKYQGKGISTTYGTKAENRRAEFVMSE